MSRIHELIQPLSVFKWRTILSLTVITLACNQANNLKERERELIIDQAKSTLNQYYKDIEQNGLMAEFNYLDSSEEFFWVPPGSNEPMNYKTVKKAIIENAGKYKSVRNTFETLKIVPLSKELASYTARLNSKMTDTTNVTTNIKMIETGTLIKRGESWKLLCGQTGILK